MLLNKRRQEMYAIFWTYYYNCCHSYIRNMMKHCLLCLKKKSEHYNFFNNMIKGTRAMICCMVIMRTHLIPTALQTSDRTLGTEEDDNLWTLQGKAKRKTNRVKQFASQTR